MDGSEPTVEIRVETGIDRIDPADWDACAAPEAQGGAAQGGAAQGGAAQGGAAPGGAAPGGRAVAPFVTHRFLAALEESGSAVPGEGWAPHHLVARIDGRVAGVMPLYLKSHSQGEYVFDHAWANAWEQAGGRYYPKLQSAVPFTPVTGPRLLVNPKAAVDAEAMRAALLRGAVELASENGLSSLHVTFCTGAEAALGRRLGLLERTDQQFHWLNHGYADFDAFLAALASRKRKQIRRERARAAEADIEIRWLTGDDLAPEHWDAFWRFYQDTGARKWGRPYLSRAFFDMLHQSMREDVLLVMCRRDGRWIAGALNLIGRDTLYGRYWGCVEDHPFLHFEACYYQAIDFAIAHGLSGVEAGAQGPHKIARGYEPVTTRSLHWIADPGFRRAVADYLERERAAVDEEQTFLAAMTPFRRGG